MERLIDQGIAAIISLLAFPVSADLKNISAHHKPEAGTTEISFDGTSTEVPNTT